MCKCYYDPNTDHGMKSFFETLKWMLQEEEPKKTNDED